MTRDNQRLQSILQALAQDPAAPAAELIRQAYYWAQECHQGQVRKDGAPMFEHVLGVTESVLATGARDAELIAAALLHDVVENTLVSLEEVRERFGGRVADLVDAVTNRPDDDAASAAQRAVEAGRDALLLRLCDRLDGVRRSSGRKKKSRREFLRDSRKVHLALAEQHFPDLAEVLSEALEAAAPD